MDTLFFLKQRTDFIRFFYDQGVKPFDEIHRKIKLALYPYDEPDYSNTDPDYQDEWNDAAAAISVLGQSCVSLLSSTLKLYFQTLEERVFVFSLNKDEKKIARTSGFVAAYKVALGPILDTDWSDCPVDFATIEHVVLARNLGEHAGSLQGFGVYYDLKTLSRETRPHFANENDYKAWLEKKSEFSDSIFAGLFAPAISVNRENLFAALAEIESLAGWIEGRMEKAWEWRRGERD